MTASGREPGRNQEALDAAGVGVWDWDIVRGELAWDATIARLHGVDPEHFDGTMEMFLARVHPGDLPSLQAAIDAAVAHGGEFLVEFRVVRPSGETRWIQGRGAALGGPNGSVTRMIGLGMDTTELRSARERAGRSAELASDGLMLIDNDWRVSYLNPSGSKIIGQPPRDIVGHVLWDLFPDDVDSVFATELRRAATTLERTRFRMHVAQVDGSFELHVFPAPDGLTVFFRRIDDVLRAEAERMQLVASLETALERGRHLQEITALLADTLSVEQVAETVLRATRRALQTRYAGVALVTPDGRDLQFEETAALPEPTREEWGRVPLAVDAPISVAVRENRSLFHESTDALLEEFPTLAATAALVGQGAFANLPLLSGGQPFGVLSVSWPDSHPISDADRDFLAVVAGQCAQAIERARLFERERSIAQMLQRAVLPELQQVLGPVRCASRYLPAEAGIEVGGDWFDAFRLPNGEIALVVGDVAGHGLETASAMAELRNMLRAYAFEDASPAAALTRLDAAFGDRSATSRFATCFYGRYHPDERTLTWTNMGHPPPVVMAPGARPAMLPFAMSPPLGSGIGAEAVDGTARLEHGTRLLLYTDGLIERRDRSLDAGLDLLLECLDEGGSADLDGLCDHVLKCATAGARRQDDICLLAVSLDGEG